MNQLEFIFFAIYTLHLNDYLTNWLINWLHNKLHNNVIVIWLMATPTSQCWNFLSLNTPAEGDCELLVVQCWV